MNTKDLSVFLENIIASSVFHSKDKKWKLHLGNWSMYSFSLPIKSSVLIIHLSDSLLARKYQANYINDNNILANKKLIWVTKNPLLRSWRAWYMRSQIAMLFTISSITKVLRFFLSKELCFFRHSVSSYFNIL